MLRRGRRPAANGRQGCETHHHQVYFVVFCGYPITMQELWLRVMKELTREPSFFFEKIWLFSLAFILLSRPIPAAAALVSLEHDQRNPAAQELYVTRQVLCSKETEPLAAPFVVR